jgi:hypothetical protein
MDDLGARAYWTSAIVSIIAALGILRPTWDDNAGSRFARVAPVEPAGAHESTQTSADDGSFDASFNDGGDLLDPAVAGAIATAEALGHDGATGDAATGESPTTPGARGWTRSRYAAMFRALQQQAGDGAAYATVDTPDSPE